LNLKLNRKQIVTSPTLLDVQEIISIEAN